MEAHKIYMENIVDSITVRDYINKLRSETGSPDVTEELHHLAAKIGSTLAEMHTNDIIHGDLTTSNMLLKKPEKNLDLYMIDFGLGYIQASAEDKGVDLYVLERALLSTHPNTEELFKVMLDNYKKKYKGKVDEIIAKFEEVRMRGRKRTMVG